MISVLHVDDEEGFLDITRRFLEKEGDIRVEGVLSAEAALARLGEAGFDAIISDYQMPGMDGITFLKKLRESRNATPFIIFTGRGREQVAIEALNSGADFYLQKGTDPKLHFIELRNLIIQAVTRHRTVEALQRSEEWYRNLAEASQDLIYIIDRDDNVVYLNRHALDLVGRKIEEVVGKPRALLFPSDADEHIKRNLATAFSGTHPIRVESLIPVGEREIWLDTTLIPLRRAGGTVTWVMGISRDVSERKRAEDALRESEELYRNLAEASRDLIYIIDRDDKVVYLNSQALEILGKRKEEVEGRSRAALFPPDANEIMKRNLGRAFSSGNPVRAESQVPFGGRISWQDTTLIPLRETGGTVTRVMGISRDITERKRMEDALRESEEKYRNLVERAHEGIIVIQDDIVKLCNRRTAEMWGGECPEIVGRPYRDFIDPSEFPHLREMYERRMAGKEVPGRYDTRLMKKNGTSFPVDLEGGDITFDGRPADLIMFRDITERKKAEEALRESEEKYRALVERANDGIIVVQDEVVKFCNRKAAEMWRGDIQEILGQPYLNFIDPGDAPRIQENYQRRVAGEVIPWQYDVVLLRKDGSKLPAELNAGTLIFEGRPASLILFRDMTERRMAEEALKNVNRKLNLLSSVTRHDLLNQVMVITGYLELARGGTSLEEVKELLDLAGKAAVIMHRQIEFTRQYQDIGVHSPVWQDLREAIAKAVPGSGTRVKIFLDIDRVSIYADPLIERVFANLIENALLHGERVTTIRFSVRVTDGALSILCEDDGIGIPAREKEKIFSPGYGRNTGFGLFLVREILGITGATIREIGQEGKGAIFEITIPGDAYRIGG